MITIVNSISQCAIELAKRKPRTLLTHAKLLGEYVKNKPLNAVDKTEYCYVTVVTERSINQNSSRTFNIGDVIVSDTPPVLIGKFETYKFSSNNNQALQG